MTRPERQNVRMGDLKRFITEALDAWNEEQERFRNKFPAVAVLGPPWPEVGADKIAGKVLREQGKQEQSQRKFLRRLKRFQYPYPEGNKKGKTFYGHLKDLGLLGFLLSPQFIEEIRTAWFLRRYYELEMELKAKRKSQYLYPMEFHRKMMLETAGHLGRLIRISNKYAVPQRWIADYRAPILKRLFHEASIVYPELRRWLKTSHAIRPHSLKVGAQLDILDAIQVQFAKKHIRNNKLAYQLTALICSPDSCIASQKLDPTPEKVRRNVKDRRNKSKKTSR
jgi:hypothetical protein